MFIIDSRQVKAVKPIPKIKSLLDTISATQLRTWVERISVPRHFGVEPEQNRATADWLHKLFESYGFHVERQGEFANIVALPDRTFEEAILVGAHYDSVPMCPGADDNGSAVAAMLGCAQPLASSAAGHFRRIQSRGGRIAWEQGFCRFVFTAGSIRDPLRARARNGWVREFQAWFATSATRASNRDW